MPFPLRAPGLELRPLDEGDIEAFVAYRQDPATARLQSWDVDYEASDAAQLVSRQRGWDSPPAGEWLQIAIVDASGALLGDLGLHHLAEHPDTYELGFTLAPHARGRGVATTAVRVALEFLFGELGAHRVVSFTDSRNVASAAVLHRCGFRQESHQVDADWFKGEWTTLDGFALLASDRTTQA